MKAVDVACRGKSELEPTNPDLSFVSMYLHLQDMIAPKLSIYLIFVVCLLHLTQLHGVNHSNEIQVVIENQPLTDEHCN